jgi:hypothetical protein
MKNISKILGLVFVLVACNSVLVGMKVESKKTPLVRFGALRSRLEEDAEHGVQFRFTDKDFDFEDFFINKCGNNIRRFERSCARYLFDLYQGKIANYTEEINVSIEAQKVIWKKIAVMSEAERKKAAVLWNNIFQKSVQPITDALLRFYKVKRFIIDEEKASNIEGYWQHLFKQQGMPGEEKEEAFFKDGYFSDVEKVETLIKKNEFHIFTFRSQVFRIVYLRRLFRGEIANPIKEVMGVQELIKKFEHTFIETTLCSCCTGKPEKCESRPTLYKRRVPVVSLLRSMEDILEEFLLIKSIIQK